MNRDEVVALTTNLENYGVLVRLVDKDFRHAALIGTVSSLVSVPTTIVDGQNFVQIKDKYSGGEAIGTTVAAVGAVLLTMSSAPPAMLIVGAALLGLGTGFAISTGVMDILHDSSPAPTKESPDKTKSEMDSPDSQPDDGGDQDTIEIPNAVAIGDPPQGLDVDNLLTDLSDFSLDLILSDIPVGWDPDTGTGIPLGGADLGGQEGGDSGGGISIPI